MNLDFKLHDFIIKPSQYIICSKNGEHKIEPKVMDLLVILAKAKGQIISRDTLIKLLWENQNTTDYALNTLISTLRKTFDDNPQTPKYIETISKLGYRLIPKVKLIQQEKRSEPVEKKKLASLATKLISHSLTLITLIVVAIICVYTIEKILIPIDAQPARFNSIEDIEDKTLQDTTLQYQYLSKVNISVATSELNKSGIPICTDTEADFFNRLIYTNKKWALKDFKWTLYSDFFDLQLHHNKKNLAGVSESHFVENGHPYGIARNKVSISFDDEENFTGSSTWKVYSFDNKLLCTGSSLFISTKI